MKRVAELKKKAFFVPGVVIAPVPDPVGATFVVGESVVGASPEPPAVVGAATVGAVVGSLPAAVDVATPVP